MDDNADAKRILLASPPADWKRQLGHPCITWLSTIQQDLKHHHLTLPEAADLAQNRPLWKMMSTYSATQLWVARQKWRWLQVQLYGPTLCTLCNWSLSESRYCSKMISLCQVTATISSCCEVRYDIVGHDHTIRAIKDIATKRGEVNKSTVVPNFTLIGGTSSGISVPRQPGTDTKNYANCNTPYNSVTLCMVGNKLIKWI